MITLRPPCHLMPANLAAGWDIVVQYTNKSWSLPDVHSFLQDHLGDQYVASEWNELLDSVLRAKGDVNATLATLNSLCNKWAPDSPSDLCKAATTPKNRKVKEDLLDVVTKLKEWRCITGKPLTLNELLDPEEE